MIVASLAHDWFGWPTGAVLTNLVAWLIGLGCGLGPTLWKLHRKLDRIHTHILDLHRHHGVRTTPTKGDQ